MFSINEKKRFASEKLLDFSKVSLRWKEYVGVDKCIINNGMIEDEILDVSDIPPTIFLACIFNTYATGLSPCIGMEFTLEDFSRRAALVFYDEALFEGEDCVAFFPQAPLQVLHYFWPLIVECHKTGKISSKKWFEIGRQNGLIWNIGSGLGLQEHPITSLGSLQGIVESAYKVYSLIKGKK